MPAATFSARALALEERIHTHIPLARAMQVCIVSFDGERVVVTAPLAANINDKGTGFAGSLGALATLAGWCLATLLGEEDGAACEAAVFHSDIDFLRPVREELRAEAWLTDASELPSARERLRAGKRARLQVTVLLGTAADPALRFAGKYAVWRQGTQPF